MGLVQKFREKEQDSEWILVDVDLPKDANRHYIRIELGYMAEDFVTQVGYTETDNGLQLGFISEAMRDEILKHLGLVIDDSIGMKSEDAFQIWRSWSRRGIFIDPTRRVRHGYVDTIERPAARVRDDFA